MKRNNCIQIVKEQISNMNFDAQTKRILEDYISKSTAKEILGRLEKYDRNSLLNIQPQNIKYIFTGNVSKEDTYSEIFIKEDYAELRRGYIHENKYVYFQGPAKVNNSLEFLTQYINLLYSIVVEINQIPPKGNEYHMQITLKDNTNYYIHSSSYKYDSLWQCLMYRYMSYMLDVYNNKIECEDKKIEIQKKKKQDENTIDLYNYLKTIFDNTDFIYAIMSYLNNEDKIKLFMTMVHKNEAWNNHFPMDKDILQHVSNAAFLYEKPCPKNVVFLQDIAEKRKQTSLGKELSDRLSEIFKDKRDVIEMLVDLRTEKMQREMIEFLNTGERNKRKIRDKLYDII